MGAPWFVLYVGDDRAVESALRRILSESDADLDVARSVEEMARIVGERDVDVIVVDCDPARSVAMRACSEAAARWPHVPLVLLDVAPRAGASLPEGVACVVEKPIEPSSLLERLRQVAKRAAVARSEPPEIPNLESANLRSPVMQEVLALANRAAKGTTTVMIRGESGTGKEVVARLIHELSGRRGPFVKVHCAALPEQILESELFGYEKGAFTGAVTRKPGRFELAEGGTLFLDEIGDISLAMQVKLLRVLQDREYERLGGTRTLKADVRFITATHRNLEQMLKANEFREDLYYRLNVVRIVVPPLRRRVEDIAPLARHFCRIAARAACRDVTLSPSAVAALERAPWPGNVRQLQNVVERLVVLSSGSVITENDVSTELERDTAFATDDATSESRSNVQLGAALFRAERKVLERALRKANGNRVVAARLLGISRRALFYKLREHGL